MSKDNLQTIIVSKRIAKTRDMARRIAAKYAKRIYTSRETSGSWRFRQRPPDDFVKGSFRSFPLPDNTDIILVYGKLKRENNPSKQRFLQFRGGSDLDAALREWDYYLDVEQKIRKASDLESLREIINNVDARDIQSVVIRDLITGAIASRARQLKLTRLSQSLAADERIYEEIRSGTIENPKGSIKNKRARPGKPGTAKPKKSTKLRSPKIMPDPGPCAWLGSIVEWSWVMKNGESSRRVDENGNALWEPDSEWMFMWSPKYKAVVSVRRPKNMYQLAEVSRYGGAARMFEQFMARPAENTFEIEVPKVDLQKLGKKSAHIVYRSNKWSPTRKDSDYIHPFEKGVMLYCGPSIKNPEVFLCFGGKLTLTKRGLVW